MRYDTLSQMIEDAARRFGSRPALTMHGRDESYTYRELFDASLSFAAALAAAGVGNGDRVAILCDSRPRWGVAFFAIQHAGAVALPLDASLGDDDLSSILDDARPAAIAVSAEYLERVRSLAPEVAPRVFDLDAAGDAAAPPAYRPATTRRAGDAALLTYTSGTMGPAKGVVTTHGNLLFQLECCLALFGNDGTCRTVSILPLSHLFEIATGFLGVLHRGGHIRYCNSLLPAEILDAMAAQQITCMLTVPLFLNLLRRAILNEAARMPARRRRLFDVLFAVSPLLPVAARRRVFRRIHQRLGGACEYFVCGGAPLDTGTLGFFRRIGVPVYQGYGMAEASPVIATNAPGSNRCGSVGRPIPGTEVRISHRGEILARGPHIMQRYYGVTAPAVDTDGWLSTGDIGYVDTDGYLFVRGRRKNVIVLGSGKKVQPEAVESVLFAHADIAEGCIVGATARRGIVDGSEEVCAVVVPAADVIEQFGDSGDALCRHVRALVVERAELLPRWQRPTRYLIRIEPLPRTATRKLRRPQVSRWAAEEAASC